MKPLAAGYDAIADTFITVRDQSIGAATVREWAKELPPGATVLDLGCGSGVPISATLMKAGLAVHGIDASPRMIAAFRQRFPTATAECSTVEAAHVAAGAFDGVVAWGLIFLLVPEVQALLVRKASESLTPGGRFLFTSPWQTCEWTDNLTGLVSVSLGAEAYRRMLELEGMVLLGESDDEAGNHYYFAAKPQPWLPSTSRKRAAAAGVWRASLRR